MSGEGTVLDTAGVGGGVPGALRIVGAADGVSVRALLGEALAVGDLAGGVLRALGEVAVSPGAADLTFGAERADGSEGGAGRFGVDGVAVLVADALDPEARAGAGGLSGDLLAVGDALGRAGEPQAAVTFGGAGGGGRKVPAGSVALVGGGVPSAAVAGVLSAGSGVGTGAGLGAASAVVVVPLAVGVRTAGLSVRAVGDGARASADLASGVPEAEAGGAVSRSVSVASGGALSNGAGGVPDAVGIFVTSGGGDVLVLTRSDALVVDPLADSDGGARGRGGLGAVGCAGIEGGDGFATLHAVVVGNTSPHASGVGDAGFLGGVLAGASGFASVGGGVDLAASGGGAGGLRELLAGFDTRLGTALGVDELAVLVVGALGDVAASVLEAALHLAGSSGPDADGVGSALGGRGGLGAGGDAGLSEGFPVAVVVVLATLFVVDVELAARKSAASGEGPVALGVHAVLLDTVHLALLVASVGGGVVDAPAVAGSTVVGAEVRGADHLEAGLVGRVPFALSVEGAGDGVGPLARSHDALADGRVPAAAGISNARVLVGREAESGSARAGLGEPLALRIVVTRLANTVAVGAGGHAGAVRLDLAFAVLGAVSGGEDLAGAAAGLELTDPLAVGVGSTSGGVADGAAGALAFLALGIPEAVRVGFALSGSGVGDGASGLAGFVDLHALAGLLAAGGAGELVASGGARAGGGVPLAVGVGLALGGAVLVGLVASGGARGGGGVPVASGELAALSLAEGGAIADAVAVGVDDASGGGAAVGDASASGRASVAGRVELAGRIAGARGGGGGDDLRALGVASQASGVPVAARVGVAAVLRRISGGALHQARAVEGDFADGRGFASLSGGDAGAGGAADSGLGVPQALRITGAANLGGVAEFAGGAAAGAGLTELAETRGNAGTVSVVRVAGGSARLLGGVPLARLLGDAVRFRGELTAGLFALHGGVVPAALRIVVAASTGSGVLDGAESRALEVLLIPSADETLGFALGLSHDLVAVLDALQRLGVPDAVAVGGARSLRRILERAAGLALSIVELADSVEGTGGGGGGLGAGAAAGLSGGVPGALSVTVAAGLGVVAGFAASNALVAHGLAHGVTVALDRVLRHGRAGFSAALGDLVVLAARVSGAGFGVLSAEAAGHDAHVVGVDAAHAEVAAALSCLGIGDVDDDLVAGGLADVFVAVPHAARVGFAGALSGVDEGALLLADHLGGVPDAVGVESAGHAVADLGAHLSTLATVPHALRIRLAGIFGAAGGAGNGAGSSGGLLTVDAGGAVGDELALSFAAVASVGPLAGGGFLALGGVGLDGAVGAALAGDDVPRAFAVDVAVAVEGVLVLELAASSASVGAGVVVAERVVAASGGREAGALSCAAGSSGGGDPSAAPGGLASAGNGVGEGRAALLALAVDVEAVGLGRAGGLVLDGTAELSAGGTDPVAVDVGGTVVLGGVAALLHTSGAELAHVVGSAGLRRGDGRACGLADLIGFGPHAFFVAVAAGLSGVAERALGLAHVVLVLALLVGSAGGLRELELALARAGADGAVPLADGDVQATDAIVLELAGRSADGARGVECALGVSIAGGHVVAVFLQASLAAFLRRAVVGAHVLLESTLGGDELVARSLAGLSGLVPHAFVGDGSAALLVGVLLDARCGASGAANEVAVGIGLAVGDGAARALLVAASGGSIPCAAGIGTARTGVGVLLRAGLDAGSSGLGPAADG